MGMGMRMRDSGDGRAKVPRYGGGEEVKIDAGEGCPGSIMLRFSSARSWRKRE